MESIIDRIKNFFRPLNAAQKTLFGLLSIGVIVFIIMLFSWALQTRYSVLFRSLSAKSAQNIVKELKASGVDYQLDNNGQTIRVPQGKVYDLRLKFAANGIAVGDNYKGYSLFDNNALGMTDFMQHLNKKRALEGELARTINSLVPIKSTRVHIVLPQRDPFQESTVDASASVLIELKPNHTLNKQQISGITALIAGSVEGLKQKNVVILDQFGNKISNNATASDLVASGTKQMKIRRRAEQYLMHKGQTLLNRLVGPGNSILRVSTEHNFKEITTKAKIIHPSSRTIISEEVREITNVNRTEEGTEGEEGGMAMHQKETTVEVRNYAVSKTNKYVENMIGGITRISASVLLNYKTVVTKTESGEVKTTYKPYSKQELAKIKEVVRAALGIRPQRGDVLAVTQMKFQDPYRLSPQPKPFFGNDFTAFEIIRLILILLVAAAIGFLIYRTSQNAGFGVNRLMGRKAAGKDRYLEGTQTEDEDIYAEKLSDEAREQLNKSSADTHDFDAFINDNTEQAAGLVRKLMKQDQ